MSIKTSVIIGLFCIFTAAALGSFIAFQNPVFWQGFLTAACAALMPGVLKLFKRKSAVEEALDREAFGQGTVRPDKFHRHPGEH